MEIIEKNTSRVLLVDDEENVLSSLKRLLFDEDFEVLTATSGSAGLDMLREKEMSVIISDQRMPQMSGAEFLARSEKISPDTVRIILTAYADTDSAIRAINEGGVYRYVSKPWQDRELLAIIREAAQRYNLLRENRRLVQLTARQNKELKKWSEELELHVQLQTLDLNNQNQELNRLNERLRSRVKDFLRAFSSLIELRGKAVSSHSNNVSMISGEIAVMAGLSEQEAGAVRTAGQLHDLGKIGVPDVVLIKDPWELGPEAAREYRRHSVRGQAALAALEEFNEAGLLVRHHHEAWNGSGFPDGLKKDAIPVGARIIAIADLFDRLARKAGAAGLKEVLKKIKTDSGKLFDPVLYAPLEKLALERGRDFICGTPEEDEIELGLDALEPGMTLSRDLHSGTGLLLLGRGSVLNKSSLDVLKKYYNLDPAQGGFFIKRPGN